MTLITVLGPPLDARLYDESIVRAQLPERDGGLGIDSVIVREDGVIRIAATGLDKQIVETWLRNILNQLLDRCLEVKLGPM